MLKKQWLIGAAATALIADSAGGYGILESRGATGADNEPGIVFCYGEVSLEGHVLTDSAQYLADRVGELIGGKVMVEIYPSGQLGDDTRCYQSMEMGTLGLYRGNSMSLVDNGNSMMSALVLPYVFRDREHFWEVCSSDLDREILDNIQDCIGMIDLVYLDERVRNFSTTDRPACRLEDIKGLKIRVQVASMMGDTVGALGAEAVPIAYAELYTAPGPGTIDGVENPPASYYYNRFYKVTPYYVKDRHTYTPGVILVSKITWKNLKKEYQDVLVQAAEETQEYNRTAIEEVDQKVYEVLEKKGVTILEPEDPQARNQAMELVYRKYGGGYLDLIGKIRQI